MAEKVEKISSMQNCNACSVSGFGRRVPGLEFRVVSGFGRRVPGLEFRVCGFRFTAEGLKLRV